MEVRLLEKLDDLLFGGSGDEEYKELFSQMYLSQSLSVHTQHIHTQMCIVLSNTCLCNLSCKAEKNRASG